MPGAPLLVDEILAMRPAHDKALVQDHAQVQPGFGGKAPIKDVQHPAAKGLDAAQEESGFQFAFALGLWSAITPLPHGCQARHASFGLCPHQDHP
jgi:hypothetical protein